MGQMNIWFSLLALLLLFIEFNELSPIDDIAVIYRVSGNAFLSSFHLVKVQFLEIRQ